MKGTYQSRKNFWEVNFLKVMNMKGFERNWRRCITFLCKRRYLSTTLKGVSNVRMKFQFVCHSYERTLEFSARAPIMFDNNVISKPEVLTAISSRPSVTQDIRTNYINIYVIKSMFCIHILHIHRSILEVTCRKNTKWRSKEHTATCKYDLRCKNWRQNVDRI